MFLSISLSFHESALFTSTYHNTHRPMPTLEVPRHLCFPNKTAARLAAFPNQKSNTSGIGVKENTPILISDKESKGACSLHMQSQALDITPKHRKSDDTGCSIPVSSLNTYEPESSRPVSSKDEKPNEAGHRDHQISCWIDAITVSTGRWSGLRPIKDRV